MTRDILFTSPALFVVLGLHACGSAAAQTNYVLGPQDVVIVSVFGEPELSRKYTIEQDGTFTFPLIGRVKARGLTLRALERSSRRRLAGDFFKDPQVSGVGRSLPEPEDPGDGRGALSRASISSPAT